MKERYWHIQMFLPEGKGRMTIDSSQMLKEEQPVIGTGEWDDLQCKYFRGEGNGLIVGDIIMVREGSRPLALCKIIGDCFHDDNLTDKYTNYWFRNVEVLDWANPSEWNSLFSQGTLKILHKHSNTDSWHYINNWYKQVLQKEDMKNIIDLLLYKKQIIFQGAPGTGKTYKAKDVAEQLIYGNVSLDKKTQAKHLKESKRFKLVQFHPSYTYEDFVRGIEVKTVDGHPEYITKNKVIGEFAELAFKNWQDSQKSAEEVSKEKWLTEQFDKFVDFVNEEAASTSDNDYQLTDSVNIIAVEEDAFRYTGKNWKHGSNRMLFKDIKQGYLDDNKTRQDIKKNNNLSGLAQQHASYYIKVLNNFREYLKSEEITYSPSPKSKVELENYVLIIDEINRANLPAVLGELIYALEYRGEKVESMYAVEESNNDLVLPSNLYIIGTMNTADRSVGQIDYAIRRRFAFVDIIPQDLSDALGEDFKSEAFQKISELFTEKYLSDEFVDKAKDVQIGHSYFIQQYEKDTNGKNDKSKPIDFNVRIEYEIKPILREYVKDGIFKEKIEGKRMIDIINMIGQ